MRPDRIAITFLLTVLCSIFLLQFWQERTYPNTLWYILSTLLLFGGLSLLEESLTQSGVWILAVTLGVFCAFSAVSRTTHIPTDNSIDMLAQGKEVILQGIIIDEPDRRPLKTKYTVSSEWVRGKDVQGIVTVDGNVLVTDYSGWPEFQYGDRIIVKGILEKPTQIEDFKYDQYLSRYNIYAVIYRGTVSKKNDGHANIVFSTLYRFKTRFEYQINRIFPEPHASFLAGLLTGSRRGIPAHLLKDFNATGLTHIIAISGYNITIVIAVIAGILFFIPLRIRYVPAIIAVICFTIFVGAEASVVRAAIMGILGLTALQTGRQKHGRLAILWTLFFMLMYNPKYLWYDAGFQLSFLAVIGLSELAPMLSPMMKRIPEFLGIREALQMTLSAQLFAIPWTAFLFHQFSTLSPIANILAAPFVPLSMLFGALGVLVSYISFPLGQVISYISWAFLEAIILIAQALSNVHRAQIDIPAFPVWMIAGYYVLLGSILFVLYRTRRANAALT